MEKRWIPPLLILLFCASIFMAYRTSAQNSPILKVEPKQYIAPVFYVNETFSINVTLNNVEAGAKLVGVHFRLSYDPDLLEVLNITEGPFLGQFNQTSMPPYTFFGGFVEGDRLYDPHILVGTLLLPNATGHWPGPFPQGNGTIASITFKEIYQPVYPELAASCHLRFLEVKLLDSDGNKIIYSKEDGYYEISPLRAPTLLVEPASYNATTRGEIFDINVNLNNVVSQWRLIGVHFRLSYDSNLIKVLNVKEGSFLGQFNQTSMPPYTFFTSYVEKDDMFGPHIVVGDLLLPNATGHWPGPFPQGNGTIATITFNATKHTTIEPEPPANCTLRFIEVKLLNDLGEKLSYNTISGFYQIPPLLYPVAAFSYEPTAPSVGEVVLFNASESCDPDYEISIFSWDFGDGTIVNTTEPIVGHVFKDQRTCVVTLTVTDIDGLSANITRTISIGYYEELTVNIDVGSVHFAGELADFHILVSDFGRRIDATNIKAMLYYNGRLFAYLTNVTRHVSTGLYRIAYEISANAEPGTYTLLVEAECYSVRGTSLKSFLVSSTLSGFVTDITQGIATVSNGLTEVKMNLTTISAKLVGIEGNVGIINSTVGTLKIKLESIDGKIGEVNGDTVTIFTKLGEVKTRLGDTQSIATTTLYTTSILSAIAVILAAAILMFMRKK